MTQGEFRRRLNNERLRRLGAALWFRLGTQLRLQDLDWAVSLLGESGDHLLWKALQAAGVLDQKNRVCPHALIQWLEGLVEELVEEDDKESGMRITPQLVWTLPERHPQAANFGATYLKAILETIEAAQRELVMTSPFLQEQGLREILNAVIQALKRDVQIVMLTHAVDNLASKQSVALEVIRREAERLKGRLKVYSALMAEGGLLHAKLVIADGERMVLGSANLTGPGLTSNVEAGVVLGRSEAQLALQVLQGLIEANIAVQIFSSE